MGQARSHGDVDVDAVGRSNGPDRPERAQPAAGTGSAGLAALQRTAGNRAVAGLLGARDPRPAGEGARWGRETPRARPETLFGQRRDVQRYTTTDSVLANVASLVGAGGAAGSLVGAVTFDSSAFNAAVGKALVITKDAAELTIDAQTYTASGTVKASGPKASVGNYEIGFLQTVYESSRNFYYEPTGHTPGLLATIAPSIFGERKKQSDTCTVLPVRDGDAGKRPWYGMETVLPFDKTDPSTKNTSMQDTPGSHNPWTLGAGVDKQHLVKTDGRDRFRSWLAVKEKSTTNAIMLNYADWLVDYGTTIAFNAASPAASVVTPTATSGAKVTGTGDGSGGQWPLHGDPVANDVTTMTDANW
ncbi:hypothetical protein Cch01nite_37380 [Cellulomonas chitinilytica]|uniref:Uncharacterized protein n=1 Tax=Cellulomonas chitinilytica TaxID=398759 RepID=A0A919P838_9CELL|nr:hypothetical protein [Cellulomonas chitinilytica]GIG23014.1 hypothetical protein Cch01nite_37380 [Cellulomonas chitinilytica]